MEKEKKENVHTNDDMVLYIKKMKPSLKLQNEFYELKASIAKNRLEELMFNLKYDQLLANQKIQEESYKKSDTDKKESSEESE